MARIRLNETEARVLRLASAGLCADEIADALALTTATVAWHLAQSYRKLGVERVQGEPADPGDGPGRRPRSRRVTRP